MLIFPTGYSLINVLKWLYKMIRKTILCLDLKLQKLFECSEVSHDNFELERKKRNQVRFMKQSSLTNRFSYLFIYFFNQKHSGQIKCYRKHSVSCLTS